MEEDRARDFLGKLKLEREGKVSIGERSLKVEADTLEIVEGLLVGFKHAAMVIRSMFLPFNSDEQLLRMHGLFSPYVYFTIDSITWIVKIFIELQG